MVDKARFGERHTCHACGCKFYDMLRNPPICPRCGVDVSHPSTPAEEAALDVDVEDETPEPDVETEEVVETDEVPPEEEEESDD